LQKKLGWIYENKLPTYIEKWLEIRKILADSPTPEQVLEMLGSVGPNMKEFEKMYSKEKLDDGRRASERRACLYQNVVFFRYRDVSDLSEKVACV
jgi:hypothetical protein